MTAAAGAFRVASHPEPASQSYPYLRLLEREVARRRVGFEHIGDGLTPQRTACPSTLRHSASRQDDAEKAFARRARWTRVIRLLR